MTPTPAPVPSPEDTIATAKKALSALRFAVDLPVDLKEHAYQQVKAALDEAAGVVPAEPATHDTPLSVEEATWTDCPEPPDGPWRWSGPINAIISDSHKFGTPWEQTLAIARWSIENLYRSGFAVVAVVGVGGEAPAT